VSRFDQSELVGGDAWDAKIRKQIKECALFVPVISGNTQARLEGYFRLEWKLAEDRSHLMAKGRPFIVPVTIDGTDERNAHVPDSFLAVQWTRLTRGETSTGFAERVRTLLEPGGETRKESSIEPDLERKARRGSVPRKNGRRWLGPVVTGLGLMGAIAIWRPWIDRGANALGTPEVPAVHGATESPGASAPANNEKSVVVLPFESVGGEADGVTFAEGLHVETIAALSRLGDVKVISRVSAQALKGTTLSLGEIGRKLEVAHAIAGNVRREREVVHLQLELRRARDEAVLWTKTYSRDASGAYAAIQREVAAEVARVLQAREQRGSWAGARFLTQNARALELFIKLRDEFYYERSRSLEELIAQAEDVVRLDPDFMPAVTLLSATHARQANWTRHPETRARHGDLALRSAEKAALLVPGGAGDGALAYCYYLVARDNRRSLLHAENMARALPNDATAHNHVALALGGLGRNVEALAATERALALDPMNVALHGLRARFLLILRRREAFDRGVAQWREIQPEVSPAVFYEGRYHFYGEIPVDLSALNSGDRAVWMWRRREFREMIPVVDQRLGQSDLDARNRFTALEAKIRALQRIGDVGAVRVASEQLREVTKTLQDDDGVEYTFDPARIAKAKAHAGEVDAAVATLRRAIATYEAAGRVAQARYHQAQMASVLAQAGRARECVAVLTQILAVGTTDVSVHDLRLNPIWDKVRDVAVFKALLADPKNRAPL
jgi:TolB-like protein